MLGTRDGSGVTGGLLPPNEQLSLWATLSAHLLLLPLFIHASVRVVSHVSHILHIVVLTPFYLKSHFGQTATKLQKTQVFISLALHCNSP